MKHHGMTNLRLPPPCTLPCTARSCCSLAKATPPHGACGPTSSLFNRSACTLPTATPPGLAHVAVGCSISSAPHAPAPLLYTRTPSACSPAPSPAISSMARLHPCHADATRMQRRPLPLHSPAQHTRRCAAQKRRAGGQGDDKFISENKRNVKRRRVRKCGGAAIFNGIARRVTRAEHSTARASRAVSVQSP